MNVEIVGKYNNIRIFRTSKGVKDSSELIVLINLEKMIN